MGDDQDIRIALGHLIKALEQLAAGNAAGAEQFVKNAKWWAGQ
jgi:hypothetical protein